MTLGELIKHYRKLNYWTCTKLAGMVNISTTQMSAIEKGKKRPSFKTYIKITRLFALTVSDRAKIDDAFLIAKHGEDYHIVRNMWESIFFNEKGDVMRCSKCGKECYAVAGLRDKTNISSDHVALSDCCYEPLKNAIQEAVFKSGDLINIPIDGREIKGKLLNEIMNK